MFQQWKVIVHGFKRSDGQTLKYGPLVRTLASAVTFFPLAGIINRTCEYMRRPPAWPAAWWGSLWLGGLIMAFLPQGPLVRGIGIFLFCLAPAALQHRLNALPKTRLSAKPKPKEFVAAALGLTVCAGSVVLLHLLFTS